MPPKSSKKAASAAAGSKPKKTGARGKGKASKDADVSTTAELEGNVSWQDIKVVQNLIERFVVVYRTVHVSDDLPTATSPLAMPHVHRCLQQYMTQTEIITALQIHANVDPAFTCLVWQKLEEQNPDFFFAYYVSIKIRDQIVAFNYLVTQQLVRVARLFFVIVYSLVIKCMIFLQHLMQRMGPAPGAHTQPPQKTSPPHEDKKGSDLMEAS
jgi:uncharacterized protein (TIGR01589 family)